MNRYKVHRVQFFQLEPTAIQCLAYNDSSHLLAVGRANCDIEIWNLEYTPYQESIIPRYSENSVEAITWCDGRLFSVGLNAHIAEYDLIQLKPKCSLPLSSGSAWCIAKSSCEKLIATGTENGYISLFHVNSEGLDYGRTFCKQEGRIISIAWHPNGNSIISGSADAIRIWNVKTGFPSERIVVGTLKSNRETIIWCLAVTSDFTIISGDSWGRISFWNGNTATQINTITSHKADILALCLSMDEKSVYASGVDPIIIQFVRAQTDSKDQNHWVRSVQRRLHTHDVKALQLAGDYIISGGIDTYLTLSKYPPKTLLKYSSFFWASVSIARKAHYLLFNYSQMLEMWQLGATASTTGKNGEILPLTSKERKLLQLNVKESETVVCCAISDDGKWLAYSTLEKLRLYFFYMDEDNCSSESHPALEKVQFLPKKCSAQMLRFTPSSNYLVIITHSQNIQVLKVDLIQPVLVHNINKPPESLSRFSHLSISNDDCYAACSDNCGDVVIYNLSKGKVHSILPHHKCQATTLSFNPHNNNLLIVYSDHKIVEYCPKQKSYTPWSKNVKSLNALGANQYYAITGISFDPLNEDVIFLHDESNIHVINKSQTTEGSESKRFRQEKNKHISFSTVKRYKHIVSMKSLTDNQLVIVEISPQQIMNTLPSALWQKKFGT